MVLRVLPGTCGSFRRPPAGRARDSALSYVTTAAAWDTAAATDRIGRLVHPGAKCGSPECWASSEEGSHLLSRELLWAGAGLTVGGYGFLGYRIYRAWRAATSPNAFGRTAAGLELGTLGGLSFVASFRVGDCL
jgi:hypothetical protein